MSSVRQTETIPEWKREEVDELVDFVESFKADSSRRCAVTSTAPPTCA
jgi:hypothetical protein